MLHIPYCDGCEEGGYHLVIVHHVEDCRCAMCLNFYRLDGAGGTIRDAVQS